MATKLQHTPTTNLFALLADEQAHSQQQTAKKAAAPPSASAAAKPQQELTPKARAEAKAQAQVAERKKKEAERKPGAESETSDLGGFSLQRNQRVKEKRLAPLEVPKEVNSQKPFKGPKDDKPFKESNRQPKAQGFKGDKPKYQGVKSEGNEGRPPRREFEKHSQGKYPRQPYAKKQGHGKGNWGEATDAPVPEQSVEELPGNPSDDIPTPSDENQPPVEGQEAPEQDKEKEKPEPEELGLDDFLKMQAEKRKALEALIGGPRYGPRPLTDEETSKLHNFTMVANTKTKVPSKAGTKEPKVPKETPPSKNQARKGEKPVAVDVLFNVQVQAGRGDRDSRGPSRAGRGPRNGRGPTGNRPQGDNQGPNTNVPRSPKGGPGRGGKTQKIVRTDSHFPSLG